jgi:hypothetical protein
VYPPERHRSAPLVQNGKLYIGYEATVVGPLKFYLKDGEECDVGYFRLFVSTFPLPMETLTQEAITTSTRQLGHDPGIENTDVWDVRTIVLRVDRNKPSVDTVMQHT